MKMTDAGWSIVPDFSERLATAMDYAGLTNKQLAERLNGMGLIGIRPAHIHRLLKGRKDQPNDRANPTFVVIAGLARACGVGPEWFFREQSMLAEERDDLLDRYAGRLASGSPEPAPGVS